MPYDRGMPYPGKPEPSHGVEMEAVVPRLPGGSDGVAFQDDDVGPGTSEHRGRGEPCGSATDDTDHDDRPFVSRAVSITST